MLRRLRVKLVCILMAVITLMLIVILGLVLHFTQESLTKSSLQMMESLAKESDRRGRPNDKPRDVRLPYFVLKLDSQNELISTEGGYYDLSDEEFIREVTAYVLESDDQTGVINEYNLRYYCAHAPEGRRIVFADISSELTTMSNLWKLCVLVGVLSLAGFLFVCIFLARWAVKPVAHAWEQQNQFVADASHELKTPLTVILTNAELIQSPECDEDAKRQSASSILTMAQQMRALVAGLLDLARADTGAAKTLMSRLDFSVLASDTLLPFEPLYYDKELSLSSEIESGIMLTGCEAQLRQVLEILLDNAMKYSPPQASVTLRLKKHGQHCLLTVANTGQPIPQGELKSIFTRFYRVDKARSNTGSYGLGLAIAKSIALEHNGKIWAESGCGVNTFFVQLPL